MSISVSNRPDIAPLLSSAYAQVRAANGNATTISLGCVPLNSPLLGPEGQILIGGPDGSDSTPTEDPENYSGEVEKEELFRYGTVAKIRGVQGTRSDMVLVVGGIRRFRLNRIIQQRPFLEAKVTLIDEDSRWR